MCLHTIFLIDLQALRAQERRAEKHAAEVAAAQRQLAELDAAQQRAAQQGLNDRRRLEAEAEARRGSVESRAAGEVASYRTVRGLARRQAFQRGSIPRCLQLRCCALGSQHSHA